MHSMKSWQESFVFVTTWKHALVGASLMTHIHDSCGMSCFMLSLMSVNPKFTHRSYLLLSALLALLCVHPLSLGHYVFRWHAIVIQRGTQRFSFTRYPSSKTWLLDPVGSTFSSTGTYWNAGTLRYNSIGTRGDGAPRRYGSFGSDL